MTDAIAILAYTDAIGRDFAIHGEHSARSCAELANLLVAAGYPDGPWYSITRTGTPSLSGPSLHRLAAAHRLRRAPARPAMPADVREPVAALCKGCTMTAAPQLLG